MRRTARTIATARHNHSWNCGAKARPTIRRSALRARQKRNLLATLFLSQGVPMLLAGDEIGHTQKGNNNAYCQDNEISWVNWAMDDEAHARVPGRVVSCGGSTRCSVAGISSKAAR